MEADPYEQHFYTILADIIQPGFTPGVIIGLLTIFLLLIASALVSGSEVAFFSLSPSNINQLEESKSSTSKLIIKLLSIPERLLATILIANNFINVGIVIISSFITNKLFDFTYYPVWIGFLIQVGVITFLLLLFGEILPKIYANTYALSFSKLMARPMNFLDKLFLPLGKLLIYSTSFVNKRLAKKNLISMDQLSDAIELTSNTINEEELILKRIIKFGNLEVKEIMTSRVDVEAVDINDSINEILPEIIESGYSRIPVYEESFDNIKGMLYIKDLLPHINHEDFKWQKIIRPPYFIPETKKITGLLKEFQANKIHMAIVIDEYGGTLGIVTLEDILEEIIGEIVDENDEDELFYTKIDNDTFLFEAKIFLNDFYKIVDVPDNVFHEIKGEAETLAGLMLEIKGEIPKKSEKITYKQFVFTIEDVDERRIKQIKVNINRLELTNLENEK